MKLTSKALVLVIMGVLIITVASKKGGSKSSSKKSKQKGSSSNSKLEDCAQTQNLNETCTTADGERGNCKEFGNSKGSKSCKDGSKCHLKCVVGRDCGAVPAVPGGNGCFSLDIEGDTMVDATATVYCNTNYNLTGDDSIRCQLNGEWSSPAASCKRIVCDDNPLYVNGGKFVSVSFPPVVGTTAVLQCDGGCGARCNLDSNVIMCQQDGTWSDSNERCTSASDCGGDEWQYFEKSCYLQNKTGMTFDIAQAYCRSIGGDLTVIETASELGVVLHMLIESGSFRYYIGYNDNHNNGTFTNVLTGDEGPLFHWANGHPLPNRNCVIWNEDLNWAWRSTKCSNARYALCEKHLCSN